MAALLVGGQSSVGGQSWVGGQDTTRLYLRSTQTNGIGATYYDLDIVAGALSDTAVVDTALNGTEIQFTKTAGGLIAQFISGRAPVGGFTLTSTDISVWLAQSSLLNNAGGRYRIFKRTAAGVESDITGTPFDNGIEATAVNAEYTWSGNVTDTVFAEDDRILLKVYVTNIGIMAMGTVTLNFNAADGLAGDSFLNIYPKAVFKANGTGVTGTVTTSQAQTVAASGTYTPAPITGTVATSQAQTIAANGTYTPAPITGTAATRQAQTISASGTYTPPAISGTVTTSQAQTVAATGSYTPAPISGTATTNQAQTVSATGAFSSGITGTVTVSQAQTSAASGTVTSATNNTSGGGAADYTSKKYIVRKDGKLLVFKNKRDALNVINLIDDATSELNALIDIDVSEKQIEEPRVAKIARLPTFKPAYDIDAMLQALQSNLQAEQLLQARQYQALLALYEQFIDDDEVELLLMAA